MKNKHQRRARRSLQTRNLLASVAGAGFVVAGLTASAMADSMSFRDADPSTFGGSTGTGDKMVLRDVSDDYSNFAVNHVGSYGGGAGTYQTRRTMLRFDVSALAGQFNQITSITLNLYPYLFDDGTNGANTAFTNTLEVYPIATANAAWSESNKAGTLAGAGDSSWLFQVHPSTNWAGSGGLSTSGTDYNATALATIVYGTGTVTNTDTGGVSAGTAMGGGLAFAGSSLALTNLINTWLTPGQNAGLLLKASDETTVSDQILRLNTGETPNVNYRPQLVVEYTPIPEPASAGVIALGAVALLRRRRAAV